jgi:transposase
MPKGKTNKKYTGEFKQRVEEDVRNNGLSYKEAMRKFEITGCHQIQDWERIYLWVEILL